MKQRGGHWDLCGRRDGEWTDARPVGCTCATQQRNNLAVWLSRVSHGRSSSSEATAIATATRAAVLPLDFEQIMARGHGVVVRRAIGVVRIGKAELGNGAMRRLQI